MRLYPDTRTSEREQYQSMAAQAKRLRAVVQQATAEFKVAQQAEGGFRFAQPYSRALQALADADARAGDAYHAALRAAEGAADVARSEWIQAGAMCPDGATLIQAGSWVRLDGYGRRMLLPPGLWGLWEFVTANPGGGSRVVGLGRATVPLPDGVLTVEAAPMAPPPEYPDLPRTSGMVDRIWVGRAEQPRNLDGALLVRSNLWRWCSPGNGPDHNTGRGRFRRSQGDRTVAEELGMTVE